MIQAKFGLNWSSGFGEDFWKSLQTDDGRQVMAIAHTGELKRAITSKWVKGFTLDTILEEDHPITIPSKFGSNWATGSIQDGVYVNFP